MAPASDSYDTLAEALAATPADADFVFVHQEGCPIEPCRCRAFAVPYSELESLGAERTAQMLAPFMEEKR